LENVIIVSGNAKASEVLDQFLKNSFRCSIKKVETASQAYSLVNSDYPFDLAVINSPLQNENSLQLAEFITEKTSAFCILLVKAEFAEKAHEIADKNGIIVVSKPFNQSVLYQSVYIVETAINRYYKLYAETVRLENKIDEIKIIDKAKFMLMQYRKISEEEAHDYLQHYAMNKHLKKIVAANEIIDKITEQYL